MAALVTVENSGGNGNRRTIVLGFATAGDLERIEADFQRVIAQGSGFGTIVLEYRGGRIYKRWATDAPRNPKELEGEPNA